MSQLTRGLANRTDVRPRRERPDGPRRKELLEAAARLFAESGFHGTSMDAIAQELGILKGSLYYWIDSKEALLGEIFVASAENAIRDAEAIVARDLPATERLRLLMRAYLQEWMDNPHNFTIGLTEYRWLRDEDRKRHRRMKQDIEDIYARVLRKGIENGEFKIVERDVTIALKGIFGMLNSLPRWYHPDGWASLDHVAKVYADLMINGLRG